MEYEGYIMKKDRKNDIMFFLDDLWAGGKIISTTRADMSPMQRRLVLNYNPFNKEDVKCKI